MHPAIKEMYDNIWAEAERKGFVKVVCAVGRCGKTFVLHSRALAEQPGPPKCGSACG